MRSPIVPAATLSARTLNWPTKALSHRRARLHRRRRLPAAALRRAHEVYDAALAAHTAGLEILGKQSDSWGACRLRPGWELDWCAAKAGPWRSPYSWLNSSPYEL
ncbi:hypothetical protein [Streptomyces sp. NPDC056308]|uniref:hypothetical protein n=1 Tax=Streptomyces sp. NPDC056308 TaxID=3345780 RepID=UPI0035DB13D0